MKYRSDIHKNWGEFKPKFKAAVRFANEKGWKFKLITELEIRQQKLETAKFLLAYMKKGPVSEAHMDMIGSAMRNLNRSTPKQLLAHIYQDEWNRAQLIPTLWYMIGSRQIGIDFQKPLNMSSMIWNINA